MKAAGVRAVVPTPRTDMLTRRVLVMEFCHGFSVRDMQAMDKHGVDREALLHRICHAWAVQMHVDGFFNAGEYSAPSPAHTCSAKQCVCRQQ
jgi:predicted unusual protein kinase regulating ubiquinone biosynthesis (AarF/ABC1/UbiB family)